MLTIVILYRREGGRRQASVGVTAVGWRLFTERRPSMCHPIPHRHSIFCILPPHILRQIALNGSPQERAQALTTLATDQTLRMMRADERLVAATAPKRPSVLSLEGEKRRSIYDARHVQTL